MPQVPEVSQDDVDKVADAIKELRFEVERGRGRRGAGGCSPRPSSTCPRAPTPAQLTGGKVSFEFVLEKVGVDPDIKAPANPQPLSGLLGQFGLGGGLALPQQQ